jgi:hypothetical protein
MLAAWTSAFEIAEILDDADYRLRALWGLYVDCFMSGRYRAALAVAERFCAYAAKTTDPTDGPIGDRLVGVALLVLGDPTAAHRAHAGSLCRQEVASPTTAMSSVHGPWGAQNKPDPRNARRGAWLAAQHGLDAFFDQLLAVRGACSLSGSAFQAANVCRVEAGH